MTDLCVCAHELHNNACRKPVPGSDPPQICACQNGQRVDLATFRAINAVWRSLGNVEAALMRILAVAETATGLQSSLVQGEGEPHPHVEVKRREVVPQLIVPR